jgi:hypothetical protein
MELIEKTPITLESGSPKRQEEIHDAKPRKVLGWGTLRSGD